MEKDDDPVTRKSVSLPASMWDEIKKYGLQERIATDAEAIRRLLQYALRKQFKGR